MSKITMPKPLGYVSAELLREFVESSSESDVDLHIERLPFANRSLNGMDTVALITTDQAEVYANAKVREALEEAAALCDRFAERDMHPEECAGAIRALIPKEPA